MFGDGYSFDDNGIDGNCSELGSVSFTDNSVKVVGICFVCRACCVEDLAGSLNNSPSPSPMDVNPTGCWVMSVDSPLSIKISECPRFCGSSFPSMRCSER